MNSIATKIKKLKLYAGYYTTPYLYLYTNINKFSVHSVHSRGIVLKVSKLRAKK